jgi:hypothetical protein
MLTTEPAARSDAVRAAPGAAREGGRRGVSLGTVCGQVVVLIAAVIGSAELHDNSFFTHLATGRLLLSDGLGRLWGGMPDPYTFTSGGRSWTVQSWFASVLYGACDELAGASGVRLLTAATCALLGALVWRLTRPAVSLLPRIAISGLVLVVGASTWASRPFLFGLVCFALTLLAGEGGLDPRWLVPVGWVWVNTHGSFPLGIVALAALALGRKLDGHRPATELRALRWAVVGVVAGGVLNPVGPRLLGFPLTMLGRSDVLAHVLEWRSPDFAEPWARVFLVTALGTIVLIARRPSYRAALPVAVFVGSALLAMRNVNVAMVALAPVAAHAAQGLGSIDSARRPRPARVAAVALAVVSPVLVLGACAAGDFDLQGYPVSAIEWMDGRGLLGPDLRIAEQDYVGNLLELRSGADARAFIDDRYELHDRALVDAYRTLREGKPGWSDVLDRYGIDVVLWQKDTPLAALLSLSSQWRVVYDDDTAPGVGGPAAKGRAEAARAKPFVVACRTTVARCVDG